MRAQRILTSLLLALILGALIVGCIWHRPR